MKYQHILSSLELRNEANSLYNSKVLIYDIEKHSWFQQRKRQRRRGRALFYIFLQLNNKFGLDIRNVPKSKRKLRQTQTRVERKTEAENIFLQLNGFGLDRKDIATAEPPYPEVKEETDGGLDPDDLKLKVRKSGIMNEKSFFRQLHDVLLK